METAKIRVCTCKQCRAAKKNKSTNLKKKVKRLINKRRRTIFCDVIETYYWS